MTGSWLGLTVGGGPPGLEGRGVVVLANDGPELLLFAMPKAVEDGIVAVGAGVAAAELHVGKDGGTEFGGGNAGFVAKGARRADGAVAAPSDVGGTRAGVCVGAGCSGTRFPFGTTAVFVTGGQVLIEYRVAWKTCGSIVMRQRPIFCMDSLGGLFGLSSCPFLLVGFVQ